MPENNGKGAAIFGLPTLGSAYTESLYAAARRRGADIRDGIWSGRWLLENVAPGDVIHLHWPSFLYFDARSRTRSIVGLARMVVILELLRRRGARIVWTAHNLYPHDGAKREWVHRYARRYVVRVADRIFAHSPTAAAILRAEFAIDRGLIEVVPHGHWIGSVPNTINRTEARRRLGLAADSRVVLFFGLCKPYKGLEQLINAARSLPPNATVLIAGEFQSPDYQAAIARQAVDAGDTRVLLKPGHVDENDLQVLFNAADVVALPYRAILTSGAAMMAMSFGIPVVAPKLGSLIDVVGANCGRLYDADRDGALASALAEALQTRFDPDGIRRFVSQFTWEASADALIQQARRHR